jgi:hypothetical protein
MQRQLVILFLTLFISGCNGTKTLNNSSWKIIQTNPSNSLFKPGTKAEFSGDIISFHEGINSIKYPIIRSENRLMIDTGITKWLFEIVSVSDSSMILRELYSKNPLEITFVKINNLKKKKS